MAKYNIHNLLTDGAKRFKGHGFIFERNGSDFKGTSFDCFAKDVRNFAEVLLAHGLYGKNIILFGGNSYNYMVADIAVMGYVGVSCTISKEWSPKDLINAAEHLNAGAVIYSQLKEEQIAVLKEKHPDLLYIVMEDILSMNTDISEPTEPLGSDVCCKIIFSSGTTGVPKAVMLSQNNMFASWENLNKRADFTPEDRDYLFLPLSHTYGGICNFLYALISGMSLYICSDTKLIMEELQMVKPTIFSAVPLIYEKLYAACVSGNIHPTAALGGNIRCLFSGGAHLRREIREFLKGAEIDLLVAYGLTETSSLVSCEYSDPTDLDSVGAILEHMDVSIIQPDDNGIGEIAVRGDNVFKGYYKNPSATSKAIDCNGFFHTGDLGRVDNGKLYLIGRKRKMILFSNGENVFPDEIESLFTDHPQINHAKVYERGGKIFASVYTAADCDITDMICNINKQLPKYAQIQEYEVISDNIETRMK